GARRQNLAPPRRPRPRPARRAPGGGETAQDLGLTLRNIRRRILPSFEVSDVKGGLGALVEEVEDLIVDVVDPGAPIAQVHRDSCDPRMSTAHYKRRLPRGASNRGRSVATTARAACR